MDHNAYREQLSALLDGELNDAEREDVLAHLADCKDCQAYFAELNSVHEMMNDLDEIAVPDGFAEGVMERLREEAAPQKSKKRHSWRGAATLAACAAVAILAINALPRMGSGNAVPSAASAPAVAYGAAAAEAEEESAPLEPAEDYLEAQMLYTSGAPEAPTAAMDALTESKTLAGTSGTTSAANIVTEITNGPEAAKDARDGADATLTLTGEGAADWLAEHGEPLGDGLWRVSVEAVNELPETLVLVGLQEPQDGMLTITFGTKENPR